jgi:5-methylcytosine-specific restriction enzyme subunit McrC
VTRLQPAPVVVKECVEYEHVDIDPELWLGSGHEAIFNSELGGKDVLRVNFSKGRLRLQATSFVGVIPINDRVILRVKPRVPLSNLTRMVIETGHEVLALSAFRDYASRGTADDWAMDLYADALLDYLDAVLDQGLLRAYVRREDEGHVPHGRLEFGPTIHRFAARGTPNKAAFSWHERTVDTAANRCIKAAMEAIHAHLVKSRVHPRKGDRARLARLAGHFLAFEEVGGDPDFRSLADPQVLGIDQLPDSRAYYRPVLDLSLLILRGAGIALELGGDDVRIGSLLIDTNDLFEDFVRVSLAKHARRQGWAIDVLNGNTDGMVDLYDIPDPPPAPFGTPMEALSSRDRGTAQPDIVLRAVDGTVPLIAEVKNTPSSDGSLPARSHVEQAVTYALRYGLKFTLLVHPWARGAKGLVYVGRVRSIDVYDYRLDLSSDAGTDGALADMAAGVAALAGLAMATRASA